MEQMRTEMWPVIMNKLANNNLGFSSEECHRVMGLCLNERVNHERVFLPFKFERWEANEFLEKVDELLAEHEAERKRQEVRQQALLKLTDEEKRALNL